MARTKAQPWVNVDLMKINKVDRRRAEWAAKAPTKEQVIDRRKATVRGAVIHGGDGLSDGAKHFGAVDCVYFVRMDSTNAYKIGHTFHLRQRIGALSTGVPVPLRCVSWVSFFDGEILGEAEARAHELAGLYGERLKGEWFNLREADVRRIVDHLIDGMREEVMGVSYNGDI